MFLVKHNPNTAEYPQVYSFPPAIALRKRWRCLVLNEKVGFTPIDIKFSQNPYLLIFLLKYFNIGYRIEKFKLDSFAFSQCNAFVFAKLSQIISKSRLKNAKYNIIEKLHQKSEMSNIREQGANRSANNVDTLKKNNSSQSFSNIEILKKVARHQQIVTYEKFFIKDMKVAIVTLENYLINYEKKQRSGMNENQCIAKYFSKMDFQQFQNNLPKILSFIKIEETITQQDCSWFYEYLKSQEYSQFIEKNTRDSGLIKLLINLYKRVVKKVKMKPKNEKQSNAFERKTWAQAISRKQKLLKQEAIRSQSSLLKKTTNDSQINILNSKSFVLKKEEKLQKQTQQKRKLPIKQIKAQYNLERRRQSQMRTNKDDKEVNQQQTDLKWRKIRCQAPKCGKDCGGILSDSKCVNADHIVVWCPKCRSTNHQCNSFTPVLSEEQSIQILTQGNILKNYQFSQRIQKCKTENNLLEILARQSYIYTKQPKYMKGIPRIKTNYAVIPQYGMKQILLNREQETHLPLTIKKSSIKNAGSGVFATEALPAFYIVCSYLGEVGVGSSLPALRKYRTEKGEIEMVNNSLFTLGWIQRKDILLMAPNKYSNIGRFINSQPTENCNLMAQLGIIQKSKKNKQICIFFVSTRQIAKGEELFYNYGNTYAP